MICIKRTWTLTVAGILLAIPLTLAEYDNIDDCLAQTDYDYDLCEQEFPDDCGDYEEDHCKINEHECDTCQHTQFPEETIQDKLGQAVTSCCADHGYIFKDQCEVIIIIMIYIGI